MGVNKFNSEGYYDPTTYAALSNIVREEKQRVYMPLVFICSPFAGDMELNTTKAQGYSRFAIRNGYIPFAPHLLFPQFLDDTVKGQRELGLFCGMVFLSKCREVWVFGENITEGMSREIAKARLKNTPIRYFNDKCEEVEGL